MVSNLVDIDTLADLSPGETTIAGQVQAFLRVIIRKARTHVAGTKNDSNGFFCGVDRSKLTHVGVDLKMQRASLFNVAGSLLSMNSDVRRLDKLPLATLIVSDVCSDVLLDFCCGN